MKTHVTSNICSKLGGHNSILAFSTHLKSVGCCIPCVALMIILPVESIDLEDFRSAYTSGSMRRIFSMSRFEHIEALKDKIIQSRLEK